jgi:hypothetical protein
MEEYGTATFLTFSALEKASVSPRVSLYLQVVACRSGAT